MRSLLRFVLGHPIAGRRKLASLLRILWWQTMSRIRKDSIIQFGQSSKLLVSRGMTGATGNVYAGLHEFREMAFFLHACRSTDLFLDVGANIGSYSILMGREVGCKLMSFEPVPSTFKRLEVNLQLNGLSAKSAVNMGVGGQLGELRFSSDLDTVNHVLPAQSTKGVVVPVTTLDEVVKSAPQILIKIDVEGYEMEVIRGARQTLKDCLGIMVELNGAGEAYGHSDESIRCELNGLGFVEVDYNPFNRELESRRGQGDNALFVREVDLEVMKARLSSASQFRVRGVEF
jgi:FkbM family methyltransferase